jgi:hypothetical protein
LPQRISYTIYSSLSEQDAARFQVSAQDRADILEEVTTELSVYLGMLYHIIEVFKGHDDFADELSKRLSYYLSRYFQMHPFSEFGSTAARLPHQHCFGTPRQECKRISGEKGASITRLIVLFHSYKRR